MPSFETLQHVLAARRASRHGVHFILGDSTERTLRGDALLQRALGLLHHFQARGASAGSEMMILVDGQEPFIDAFWACVQGGIIAVPIAPGIADEHRRKFFRVLGKLTNPHLATERRVWDRIHAFAIANGFEDALSRLDQRVVFFDEIADLSVPGRLVPAAADDIAFVQFSSGSTSEPKGVVLTHRNLITNIDAIIVGVDGMATDTMLSWMPLTHDMGLIGFHLVPMVADIDHYLLPTPLFVRRPLLWLEKVSEHRATFICSPNFGYKHYLRALGSDKTPPLTLSQVRILVNGAEPIAADLCRDFLARLASTGLPANSMFPVYGLAEASLGVAFPKPGAPLATVTLARGALGPGNPVREVDPAADDAVTFVKVGTPINDCEVRISDEEGSALPERVVGRILIRGGNVTAGYYHDPERSKAGQFEGGYLDTGDLGVVIDGQLVITGRLKEILFVAGQNHYPHDIEDVLARHADIEQGRAAAAGVHAPHVGTDDVVVFVVAKGALAEFLPIARTVRRVVNERMGLPVAAVVPVVRLPKTTSGKVQRYALARDYESGSFAAVLRELADLEDAYGKGESGALDAVEQALLHICQPFVPKRMLALDDNLFELGTSSLALAQIYEKVDTAFPGRLEVNDFFDYPTVRAMAVFLAEKLTAA